MKRRLLSLARRAHIPAPVYPGPPRPEPRALPQESRVSTEEPTDRVEDLYPLPTPKAEPRVRVVHRTPKWFDDKPSFRDMTF